MPGRGICVLILRGWRFFERHHFISLSLLACLARLGQYFFGYSYSFFFLCLSCETYSFSFYPLSCLLCPGLFALAGCSLVFLGRYHTQFGQHFSPFLFSFLLYSPILLISMSSISHYPSCSCSPFIPLPSFLSLRIASLFHSFAVWHPGANVYFVSMYVCIW